MKKKKPSPFPKTWKEKKQGTLSACLGLPIGCTNFLFPSEFVTIFGLGQYPLQRTPYLFRLINWGCLTNPTFFFFLAMIQFDWPIAQKSWNHGSSPKIADSMEKMDCLPLWPTYIGEKGRTLGKTYRIKAGCYWEHPWGTHWEPREHIENTFECLLPHWPSHSLIWFKCCWHISLLGKQWLHDQRGNYKSQLSPWTLKFGSWSWISSQPSILIGRRFPVFLMSRSISVGLHWAGRS
jgi:hypothetical protein